MAEFDRLYILATPSDSDNPDADSEVGRPKEAQPSMSGGGNVLEMRYMWCPGDFQTLALCWSCGKKPPPPPTERTGDAVHEVSRRFPNLGTLLELWQKAATTTHRADCRVLCTARGSTTQCGQSG